MGALLTSAGLGWGFRFQTRFLLIPLWEVEGGLTLFLILPPLTLSGRGVLVTTGGSEHLLGLLRHNPVRREGHVDSTRFEQKAKLPVWSPLKPGRELITTQRDVSLGYTLNFFLTTLVRGGG